MGFSLANVYLRKMLSPHVRPLLQMLFSGSPIAALPLLNGTSCQGLAVQLFD